MAMMTKEIGSQVWKDKDSLKMAKKGNEDPKKSPLSHKNPEELYTTPRQRSKPSSTTSLSLSQQFSKDNALKTD